MAHITGGKVSYGRTVKTGDYENKRVDVELSFSIDESEDVAAILQDASMRALTKAHEMLDLKVTPAHHQVAAAETKNTAAKATKAAEAITVEEDRQAAPSSYGGGGGGAADIALKVVDELDAEGVTDAQLTDAAKAANKKINNPVAIKGLRDKYTGKTPSILSEIPAPKRKAFLDELAKLK